MKSASTYVHVAKKLEGQQHIAPELPSHCERIPYYDKPPLTGSRLEDIEHAALERLRVLAAFTRQRALNKASDSRHGLDSQLLHRVMQESHPNN